MFEAIIKFGRQNPDCTVNDVVIILHKKDQEVKKVSFIILSTVFIKSSV